MIIRHIIQVSHHDSTLISFHPYRHIYVHTRSLYMANKLTRIQKGCYLTHTDSFSSIKSGGEVSSQLAGSPEPVTWESPVPLKQQVSLKSDQSIDALSSRPSRRPIRDSIDWLSAKEALNSYEYKPSRLSLTPSIIRINPSGSSFPYSASLLNKPLPPIPLGQLDDTITEPPDGGFLAWAHSFAGHLAVFNAQ